MRRNRWKRFGSENGLKIIRTTISRGTGSFVIRTTVYYTSYNDRFKKSYARFSVQEMFEQGVNRAT